MANFQSIHISKNGVMVLDYDLGKNSGKKFGKAIDVTADGKVDYVVTGLSPSASRWPSDKAEIDKYCREDTTEIMVVNNDSKSSKFLETIKNYSRAYADSIRTYADPSISINISPTRIPCNHKPVISGKDDSRLVEDSQAIFDEGIQRGEQLYQDVVGAFNEPQVKMVKMYGRDDHAADTYFYNNSRNQQVSVTVYKDPSGIKAIDIVARFIMPDPFLALGMGDSTRTRSWFLTGIQLEIQSESLEVFITDNRRFFPIAKALIGEFPLRVFFPGL